MQINIIKLTAIVLSTKKKSKTPDPRMFISPISEQRAYESPLIFSHPHLHNRLFRLWSFVTSSLDRLLLRLSIFAWECLFALKWILSQSVSLNFPAFNPIISSKTDDWYFVSSSMLYINLISVSIVTFLLSIFYVFNESNLS